VQPHPRQVNPYHLGITILREIMRIATEPEEEERERWPWAGAVEPFEQVRAVCRDYDDEALLREFLTPSVCERARLFAFQHLQHDPRRIRVSSRECDVIRELLIRQHSTFGIPHIEITDADYGGRGELYLEHHSDAVGLDAEYARGTLAQMAMLWGRPVIVATSKQDKPIWYFAHPDGRSEACDSAP
jgi:stage V sporulation protein R